MVRIRLLLIAVVFGIAAGLLTYHRLSNLPPQLSRQEFLVEVRAGHVRKVVIHDNDLILATSTTRGPFRTPYKPGDTELIAQLQALGVEVDFEDSGLGLI